MQVLNGATLFSASDLVNFLECEHTTTLGLVDLVTPLQRAESDESNQLVQDKGFAHEESFLESLRAKGLRIAEIPQHLPAEEAARATLEALADGPDIIFQAAFLSLPFYGRADFLLNSHLKRSAWRSCLRKSRYRTPVTSLLPWLASNNEELAAQR